MPLFYLRTYVLENFPNCPPEPATVWNVSEFMIEQFNTLERNEIASRLMLNCLTTTNGLIELQRLSGPVTLIDSVDDEIALPNSLRDSMYSMYPLARRAYVKNVRVWCTSYDQCVMQLTLS